MKYIKVTKYKYKTVEDLTVKTLVRPKFTIVTDYGSLTTAGTLFIPAGTLWDGPSGPTIDDKSNMTPSLVHDVLYRFMREGELPQSARKAADQTIIKMCIDRGMWKIRAWAWLKGLKFGAWWAAWRTSKPQDKIYEVP